MDILYNQYISPLTQKVTRETLLPLQQATIFEEGGEGLGGRAGQAEDEDEDKREGPGALVEYEPGPEEILQRLVPAYVEISIYRALLESTASEHGARMTAMRNASENATDLIKDLTLQMNRERQAEITQEIMEVVAGAESLTLTACRARQGAETNGSQHQGSRADRRAAAGAERERQRAQRRPDRGDPGRRDRGRVPRQAARDQLGDHRRARDRAGRRGGREHQPEPRLRGPAAPRRRPRPRGGDGHHRRRGARHRGHRHRRPDHGARSVR